jgi:hypothetical protein
MSAFFKRAVYGSQAVIVTDFELYMRFLDDA